MSVTYSAQPRSASFVGLSENVGRPCSSTIQIDTLKHCVNENSLDLPSTGADMIHEGSSPEQMVPSVQSAFVPSYFNSPSFPSQQDAGFNGWQRNPTLMANEYERTAPTPVGQDVGVGVNDHPRQSYFNNSTSPFVPYYHATPYMANGLPNMQISGYPSSYNGMPFLPYSAYSMPYFGSQEPVIPRAQETPCSVTKKRASSNKSPTDDGRGADAPNREEPAGPEELSSRREDNEPSSSGQEVESAGGQTSSPVKLPNLNEMSILPTKACVFLCNQELWIKFDQCGTEMIVTKQGRRMFPQLSFKFTGLEPDTKYKVLVDMVLADPNQWKYSNGKWTMCGQAENIPKASNVYVHPDSPNTGAFWMRNEVVFNKLKLTNHKGKHENFVVLNSMHRYQPRIHVLDVTHRRTLQTHSFAETQFYAVTAYQNTDMTQLKIDYNPFAKGFRDGYSSLSGRNNCDTSRRQHVSLGSGFPLNVPAIGNGTSQLNDKHLFNFNHLITDRSHVPVTTIHHHQSFPPTYYHNVSNKTHEESLRQRAVVDEFKTAFPLTSADSSQELPVGGSDLQSQLTEDSIQAINLPQANPRDASTQQEVLSQTNGDPHDEVRNADDNVFEGTTKRQRLDETTHDSFPVPFYRNFMSSDTAKNSNFLQSSFYDLNEIHETGTPDNVSLRNSSDSSCEAESFSITA